MALQLPFVYELEAAPRPCDLQTTFATYTTTYSFQESVLNYARRYELKMKTIPAESYIEYVDFIKKVAQNDQTKFVFKK